MATTLQAFLIEAARTNKTHEITLNGRLKEFPFTIRELTLGEWNEARKRAVNDAMPERIDSIEVTKQIVIAGCVSPNFKDAEFIKSCGCITPGELIDKVLLAGEVTQLSEAISRISGFGNKIDELKDEAKN